MMRYVYSFAAAMVALTMFAPVKMYGQGAPPELSIGNYEFVSEQRSTRTDYFVTYRASLLNTGAARGGVTATVSSLSANVSVVPGQGTLHFAPVPSNVQVRSGDTFTILVDRTVPFDFASLKWSFLSPTANAGPSQTAPVGTTITLNGSASTNPSGVGSLAYSWAFSSKPAGSSASLATPNGVMSSFVIDTPGNYVVTLTVSNGAASDSASVTISTVNTKPVAKAGPDQTVSPGATVNLNGSASFDVDGDPLTYFWTLISAPAGSSAFIANFRSVGASFVADKAGSYVVQLVVNDGKIDSLASTVTIRTGNTPPVANAGPAQTVVQGALVQLNGSGSTDVDGNTLTYKWSLITVPSGSSAHLSSTSAVNPTFTADLAGTYVAQLIVNDGIVDSPAVAVTITTNALQAPTANAGANQTVVHGTTVTLNGSGTDPQNLPLTMVWSLITRPVGSAAVLPSTTSAHPTFVADQPGIYVAQLMVSNGTVNSAPATVTITTTNTKPVANAGANQNVSVAATVALNGGASSDADNDPLSYTWTFGSKPSGSNTLLLAASSKTPTFVADVAGTYVVQLIVNDGFQNSDPQTVTITASALKITLSPSPLALSNSPGTLTITLSAPAGGSGQVVSLTGFDPAVVSMPASVTVPANSTGANVTVTPVASGSTTVLASGGVYQPSSATITVNTPVITLTTSAPGVQVGKTISGTITLSSAAPGTGTVVTLSDPSGFVSMPPTVTIGAGNTTGSFVITGAVPGSTNISATSSGYVSGTANVLVSQAGAIALGSGVTVGPNQTAILSVNLSAPASSTVTVSLVSSDPSKVTVPASVTILAGATAPATQPVVTGVNYGTANITATATGYSSDSKPVSVAATLAFTPGTLNLNGPESKSWTLTLSAPAPAGGLTVNLAASTAGIATIPASVSIAANQTTTASFSVSGAGVGSTTVTATTGLAAVPSTTGTVNVASLGSIGLPSGVTVGLGQTAAFQITLPAAAASAVTVTLTSSDPTKVSISPATVTIAAGATSPATAPQVTGVAPGTATITASAPFYTSTGAGQSVQTTATIALSPANLPISGTATQNLTLTLSGPAPAGGLTFALSSSTAFATVPASVTIAANSTTAQVPVTGVNPGTAVIRASAAGFTDATANVTVTAGVDILIPAKLTLSPGDFQPFNITLAHPAVTTTFVQLAVGDPSVVTLSTTGVTIDAGNTQPTRQPNISAIGAGTTTITASANGLQTATTQIVVGLNATLSPSNLTILGTTNDGTLTLNLSGPAPTGGLTFTLKSSNTAVATVPPSLPVSAGTQVVSFKVTGVSAGSTVVTASAAGLTDTTANVTVQPPGSIALSLSANSLQLGQTANLTVTLSAPAPPNGVTVALSHDAKITLPASVTIPAGATTGTATVLAVNVGNSPINASASGYTSPAAVTVAVGATIAWTTPSTTIVGNGVQVLLSLRLYATVPGSNNFSILDGLVIDISSTNTAVATTPPQVNFFWDGSTVPEVRVPVTSVGPGTTTIHASGVNIPDVTTTVIVSGPLGITTTNLPTGQVGTAYNATVAASGGNGPYSWSITGGTLPAGLTLNAATGAITGTPNPPASSVSLTFQVTDASSPVQTSTKVLNLVITPAPLTISTTALTAGQVNVPYNMALAATGGTSPYSFQLQAGSTLPSGLTMSAAGVISGTTATAVSNLALTFQVFDNGAPAQSATKTLNLTIAPPGLSITTTSLPNGQVGAAYSQTLAAAGGSTPYSWSLAAGSTLPSGFTLSTAGVLSGNPATAFTNAAFTVQVTDAASATKTQALTLTVTPAALSITTGATLPTATVGTAYSQTLAAIGGTPGYAWAVAAGSTLPSGFSLSTSGVLSGNPASPANASFTIQVTDTASVVASKTFTLSIATTPPVITTAAALPAGTQGVAYSQTLASSGGTSPYTYALAAGSPALPGGLTLSTSGVISGTPNTAVSGATFTIQVTDATVPAQTATKAFTLTIGTPVLAVATTSVTNGQATVAYSFSLSSTGGTGPYSWSLAAGSTLPANLSLSAAGIISGTPQAAVNSSPFTVKVTDSLSATATAALTITITPAPLVITTATPLTAGQVGTAYSLTFGATGGTGPYTWSLAPGSTTPGGLTLNAAGVLSGNPNAAVTNAPFTVQVTDANSTTVSKAVTLTIAPAALVVTTASLPPGKVNVAYSQSLAASGGTPGYTWSLAAGSNALPGSLTLSPAGVISGTPNAAVTSATFTVQVTDAAGTPQTATKALTLTIAPLDIAITTTSLPNAKKGVAYSQSLAATGGTPAYSWTLVSGSLPNGLTLSTAGVISGTATVPVTNQAFTVQVADAGAPQQSITKALTLTVDPGTASNVSISSGSGQSVKINTAYASPLAVLVTDASAAPVQGVTVTFAVPASGASVSFTGGNTAVTDVNGIATSNAMTANSVSGPITVVATATGGASVNLSLTNLAGNPSTISVVSGTPQGATILTAFALPLKVLVVDAFNNNVSGQGITFTAPSSGASATFAGGVNTATTDVNGVATSVLVSANSTVGNSAYQVVASVNGFPGLTAAFTLQNQPGSPNALTVVSGTPQSVATGSPFAQQFQASVTDIGGNPLRGVDVTFTAPGSGASGLFANGTTQFTAQTDSLGLAVASVFTANSNSGSYHVYATLPSFPAITRGDYVLTNSGGCTSGCGGTITVTNAIIGANLQAAITVTLSPAPTAAETLVTFTSNNPSLALISRGPNPGVATTTGKVLSGITTLSTFIQALGSSGSTTITVSAPGYADGTATITAAPSGFVISSPNGIGAAFTVFQGSTTPLSISAGRLDGSGVFAAQQQVRGDLTTSVPVGSSNTGVGNVATSSVTFTGGSDTANVNFVANSPGGTTVSLGPVSGFSTPSTGTTLSATVQQSALNPFSATVGQGLEKDVFMTLNAPAQNNISVTLHSQDASKMLFWTPSLPAPAADLTIVIPINHSVTPTFYVVSAGGTGSVGYTADASSAGLGTVTGSVNLVASKLLINSGADINAPVTAGSPNITVHTLATGTNEEQLVAVGTSVSVTVTSSKTTVASVSTATFSITGNNSSATTTLVPVNPPPAPPNNSTVVTATATNFQASSINATFTNPQIIVDSGLDIGRNLQQGANFILPTAVTGSPLTVTITSNSANAAVSNSATAAGSTTTTVTVPVGSQSGVFYVQGLSDAGLVTFTATGGGYGAGTGNATLHKSAIVFLDTSASGNAGTTSSVRLVPAWLDDTSTPLVIQALAGGSPLSVTIHSSNTSKVSTPATVTVAPNGDITPLALNLIAHTTSPVTITLDQPAGFSIPASRGSASVTVN